MAFDGITVAALAKQLNDTLSGGRIYKIAQTERDELLLTIKITGTENGQYRLFLSANASLPLVYLTDQNKTGPQSAPAFCMLLRKHLQNGRIRSVTQPGLERILRIEIEHLDEMGDLRKKTLLIELMGKYSNIIFIDENETIIDAIKHIPASVSSVREVLPSRAYFVPNTQDKRDPLKTDLVSFAELLRGKGVAVHKALYGSFTGISPIVAQELCYRAQLDADLPAPALTYAQISALFHAFDDCMQCVRAGTFSPVLVYAHKVPREYAAIPLTIFSAAEDCRIETYEDISALLVRYYAEKSRATRIRQKSADLRHIVQTALERAVRKYDQQLQQMRDTEKKDKYRLYGELLQIYGFGAAPKAKSVTVTDYHTEKELTIPLDPTMTASQNAQHYFARYNKLKRTYETLSELTKEVRAQVRHLESVQTALDIATEESDLEEIRQELIAGGYLKGGGERGRKKSAAASRPFHYISSDGFDLYVGKNNYQNDRLTFHFAEGNDWWFHAKGLPGSHVVLRSGGREVPDRAFEEAAALAAYYSRGRAQEKVEIDYLLRRDVKKPGGSKPGFVVYYTNYSMMAGTDISALRQLSDLDARSERL